MISSKLHHTRVSWGLLLYFTDEETKAWKIKQFLYKSHVQMTFYQDSVTQSCHPALGESKACTVSPVLCQANFDFLKALFRNLIHSFYFLLTHNKLKYLKRKYL